MTDFEGFRKIPRLFRDITITEKIDGTNGQIFIEEIFDYDYEGNPPWAYGEPEDGDKLYRVRVGSRSRWITPDDDNFGFAKWVWDNATELVKLGEGRHFGEWWGSGIQRGYGLQKGEKRFSLFNTKKWTDNPDRPSVCGVVPVLYEGMFNLDVVEDVLYALSVDGSSAAPGFPQPEGVIVYHHALNNYFKATLVNDQAPKGQAAA